MKKTLFIMFFVLLIAFAFAEVKNPDTFFWAGIGEPDTLDPHYAYDTGSGEIIYHVYENLIGYKGSSLSEFIPLLSEEVPSLENGYLRDDGKTYIFKIRKNVKFHNGNDLTPEDVEYSFERALTFNPGAGPIWMLFDPLFGAHGIEPMVEDYIGMAWNDIFDENMDPVKPEYKEKLIEFFNEIIDPAVEVKGDEVWFNLPSPFGPFLNILALSANWAAVMDKEWSTEIGNWDGNADGWWKYHDWKKEDSPMYAQMNGTGPFVFKEWDRAQQKVILERNDNYWREPANFAKVIVQGIDEWSTRKSMLEKGDADGIVASAVYLSQVREMKGITLLEKLPTLSITALSFNWDIKPESKYVGSGKLDGEGVPLNFFEDEYVRLGFAYAFDYEAFINDVLNGMGKNVPTVLPDVLLGYDDTIPKYYMDLERATTYFKRAFRGKLWAKGFKMTILYNTGNAGRQKSAEILRDNLAKINPKFKVEVSGVQWPTFLDARKNGLMPIFIIGWLADYPDPHNFIFTYYHSMGDYGKYYGQNFADFVRTPFRELNNMSLDDMIMKAAKAANPKEREALYKTIQEFVVKHGLSMALYQPEAIRAQKDWVKGYYRNAVRPGNDFYSMSKSEE